MPAPPTRVRDVWRDQNGALVQSSTYVITNSYQAVAIEVQQLTGSTNPMQHVAVANGGVGDGAFFPSGSVYNMARLVYRTTFGGRVVVWLPSPDSGIYLSDGETVNPGAIIGLTDAVIANCSDASGYAIVQYESGQKTRLAELPIPLQ